ncbi:MAG: glutamate 5-kinase [bacterium]|nr:glutamate 5-kinase [bacterium]MDT8365703.1 glutamate 5-kinase [bacterium]
MIEDKRSILKGRKRVIVKLGSMVLAAPGGGIDQDLLNHLADEMAAMEGERDFIIVSSGAILMGMQAMGYQESPRTMKIKQALAAVGQGRLVQAYADAFARHGKRVGQVLLTREGLENRRRFVLSHNTLETLLKMNAVPVINENDTVSVEEIRFGDNDLLASMVVNLAEADLLVLLTNTEGLFDKDPRLGDGKLVEVVEEVDSHIVNMAGGPGKSGSGGMSSKVLAAKRTAHMGVPTVIADGRREGVLTRVLNGDPTGTLFLPSAEKLALRKHWIAYSSGQPKGTLVIDAGASKALKKLNKSLLPAGVREVLGDFEAGSMVRCMDANDGEIARGVTCFSSDQIRMIMGRHSDEIESVLGTCPGAEVIHRDDLVISADQKDKG